MSPVITVTSAAGSEPRNRTSRRSPRTMWRSERWRRSISPGRSAGRMSRRKRTSRYQRRSTNIAYAAVASPATNVPVRMGTSTEGIVVAELKTRLQQEMKDALRAGDKVRLGALRLLHASVKNREVELLHEVDDEEFVEVVGREVKRRKEAAEAYEKAGRQDLLDRERREQEVLEAYLPDQLPEEEVSTLVDEAVAATGASGPGDLGKVMGYVMGKARGRVDGSIINRMVRERLSSGGER